MKKQVTYGRENDINMGTNIRPKLSTKNKYWIDKHRYYELKHFCLQYPMWKKLYLGLDGLVKNSTDVRTNTNVNSDPTSNCAVSRAFYSEKICMLERCAEQADPELASYILKAVTEELSYNYLKTKLDIPCSKDTYYDRYRKFFWILHKERG